MRASKQKKTDRAAFRPFWAALLTASAVAMLVAVGFPETEQAERGTYGMRFALRPPRATRSRMVIAALDTDTERRWQNEPIVFWTGHYAQMIRNARAAGALVIAFDVIPEVSAQRFVEGLHASDDFHPDSDFMDAVQDAGGDALVFAETTGLGTGGVGERPAPQFLALPEISGNLAFTDLPFSSDNQVYETLLHTPATGAGLLPIPSFPTLIAEHFTRLAGIAPPLLHGIGATGGDAATPSVYVNYIGRSSYPVSAVALANGTASAADRAAMKGAVVLIGRTTAGSSDLKLTPGGILTPGVEVQAQAAATLIDDRPLRRLPPFGEAVITLLFGLTVAALVSAGSTAGRWTRGAVLRELPFVVMLVGLVMLLTFGLFDRADFLFPMIGPLLAIGLPYAATLGVRAVDERRQREHIGMVFGTQSALSTYMLDHPESVALGGQAREAAVLFFDIRDSTGKEEKARPEAVIDWLNELFQQIVPPIKQSYRGLVYKFTGDGFLAIFGAPEPIEMPARQAIEAAIAVVRAARGYRWPDGQLAEVGCAVHYGTVAAGCIGTDDRSEFTVIGNIVNVAAKIESLNKATDDCDAANVVVTDAALQAAGLTPEMLPGRLCRALTTTLSHGQAVPVYCFDVTLETDGPDTSHGSPVPNADWAKIK